MKANERTAIVHPDVVLVPYREEHVDKYHEWMTSEELRELTASEPLTLEEEYEMQRKWQADEDKLTFILLLGSPEPERGPGPGASGPPSPQQHQDDGDLPNSSPSPSPSPNAEARMRMETTTPTTMAMAMAQLAGLPMIGDVNLFFKGENPFRGEELDGDEDGDGDDDFEVEVEIMIADPAYRRRGIAHTALQLLLSYATDPASPPPLPIARERLVARIGARNTPSIRLFEKLGFAVTKTVAVFEEVELRFADAGKGAAWARGCVRVLDG